ncbi:MAG: glycosyltransferase family 2 protein [Saprospiraceae bacterium]|nr:glycosyltransferase family 2 protein [Saprospiraceae bacterium]
MIPKKDVHIYIPAYNEESIIGEVLQRIHQYGYPSLSVIDDGSTDRTAEYALQANSKVIQHLVNRGVGAATQTAIEGARRFDCPYMILMDADGQHLPEDLEVLIQRMSEGDCDLVIGSRLLGDLSGMPKSRRWFNSLANLLTNLFCKSSYSDTQSGFRMLNRKAIELLQLSLDEYGFCSEMIILAEKKGLKIVEVPIQIVYTQYSLEKGQDFYTGIRTAFNFLWKVVSLVGKD